MGPKDILIEGCKILDAVLVPFGFVFIFRGAGHSCGGQYAWGEFVRDDRRLELHFRHSLGLVRYHIAETNVAHKIYMRELGVSTCRYPGASTEPLDAFRDLAHDLQYADDFIFGDASILKIAAASESVSKTQEQNRLLCGYVGDVHTMEKMRLLFKQGRYVDVVSQLSLLQYPERLTPSETRLIEIARKRKEQ